MNRWQQACVAGAIGVVSVSVSAIDTPPTWEAPEIVALVGGYFTNFAGYTGHNRYMQFDHFGEVGIGYANVSQIYYARRVPGLGWQSAEASPFLFDTVASQPSLVFNPSEQPRMSFVADRAATDDEARWARWVDGDWTDTTAISPDFALTLDQLSSSATFDNTGRAMMVMVTLGEASFKHDTDGNGDFFAETLEIAHPSSAFGPSSCSFVLDPIDRPMIATSMGDGDQIRFAVRDTGTGWAWATIATDADFPSLAIVPGTGFPALAYTDTFNDNLVYGEWDGDQWVFTNIDTTGSTGWWPSLAFDPADGNPAIAYQGNGSLKLAWHDGVQWNLQVVVGGSPELPTGYTPSLAFNEFGNGFPAIAYFGLDSALYYIEDPPPPADLDGDGYVGIADFLLLLNAWGDCDSCPPSCSGDLDGDCTVGITDFLLLLAAWS